jgi:hypothetical protein
MQRHAQLLMGHGMFMQSHAGQMMLELQASRAEVAALAFAVQQMECDPAPAQPQHG